MKKKNPQKDGKKQKAQIKRSQRERARKQEAKTKTRKPAAFKLSASSAPKSD